ncbi:MAG: 2-oxo acid dehydrogenase subunit E2 [Akkermansiaceae bacterium]|nr:2-oxo acid dehydrogenase subunit E2 [Akkermansiaceae bacterium]
MSTESAIQSKADEGADTGGKPGPLRVPLSMVQKTMAKRMLQSAREIPQFSVSWELDADQLATRRSRINAEIEEEDRRVSVTALLIWLAARALGRHPRMNSRFDEDAAIQPEHVNMAVAMDTPYGLVAPVIRKAETLSVAETGVALKELASRAAAKRLAMGDFADGTFTITNLGMFGVTRFTPLVNPPQGAIMGVGGPRTTVRTDPEGRLVAARVMELTVTADHRILDGAEVARFLQTLGGSVGE